MSLIGVIEEISRRGAEDLSVEWRILNFPSLLDGTDRYYGSPSFRMGDQHWQLGLWTNCRREARNPSSGWLKLELLRNCQGPPSTVRCFVGIRGSGGVEKSREGEREFNGIDYYTWDDFCSRSDLLEHRTRLIPEDTFTIRCALRRPGTGNGESSRKRKFVESGEASVLSRKLQGVEELQKALKSVLRSGEDSNVVLKVQGKEFRAHRSILKARSPVFEAMFSHDMVEKQSNIVTIEDCDPETFPHFLEHVYTGSVEMISTANVFSLYTASEKYDLPTLKNACADFVKKNLTVACFCDAVTLAFKYDDKELMERATEFYCNNTLDIVKTEEWKIFLAENPTIGNNLYIKQLTK